MTLLAVDTALGGCSAALLDGEKILAHRFEAMDRGHAEALAPMVDALMRGAGATFAQLQRLAVTTGPGTFTGQRVGLAFMRGLRLALHIPLNGVTTLEVIAAAAMAQAKMPRAAVLHDARRGEAYLFLQANDVVVQPPAVMDFAQAIEKIRDFGPCVLAGTGAPAAAPMLAEDVVLSPLCQPDALWVAGLAQKSAPALDPPAPLYLRAPDAKLPDTKKSGGKVSA